MYDPRAYPPTAIDHRHHWLTIKHDASPLTNTEEKKELAKYDERLADILYEIALQEEAANV
jgi:hypothetical protein